MKRVLVGGCFNKIHPGHIYFLKKAKGFGYLTVILTHDKNNKKPYAVPAVRRRRELQKLKIADKIIVGHPTNYPKTMEKIKPDLIALGYDQGVPWQIKAMIKANKIKTVRIKQFKNYSTRRLI